MASRVDPLGPTNQRARSVGSVPADASADGISLRSSALARYRRIATGIAVSDALCAVGAVLVVYLLRFDSPALNRDFVLMAAVAPIAWVAVFHAFGLYRTQHLAASEEFRRIISATSVGVVLIMVGSVWWDAALSRSWLASTWLVALLFEFVARRLWRWRIRSLKRTGDLALRTLVVGTNAEAQDLASAIDAPVRGFIPIGYVATAKSQGTVNGIPVVGSLEDLDETIRRHGVECVFVASTAVPSEHVARISQICRKADVEMRVSANLPEILTSRLAVQPIDRVMALSVRPVRLSGTQAALKRTFDLVVASFALLLSLPFMGLIAVAIRLTSDGPAMFRQQRVTKDGRLFTMYKFRTMIPDPEPALRGRVLDLTKPFFKLEDDPRLTKVGRMLRALSLDELPQLWNVVRGEMSLVGPRPLPAEQVAANPDVLAPRHEVRSGLTGWWQINGRSDVDAESALRMDAFYIENWSLGLDLYIVLKTAGSVLTRRGVY